MKSIVFTISLLVVVGCVPAMACAHYEVEPKAHWIFFTGYYADNEWQTNLNKIFREENITFWRDYVGDSVSRSEVEDALYHVNLLDMNTTNEFFRLLIDRNDTVALGYWMSLKATSYSKYEEERWRRSAWYFPVVRNYYWYGYSEPEEQSVDLSIIKVKELNEESIELCPDKNIRNRYVLQVMRKYFYIGDNQSCIGIWEKYGNDVPQSALRTQCLNYYGGALLRLERRVEAAVVYAGIGYCNVYLHYDPNVLREIYRQQPNCKCFEFMVQQFVNQYFDNPKLSKANEFNKLVDEIVRDGKSTNPALWKSAQAAIAYINNNTSGAIHLLSQAEKMRGSNIVKENIRMLRLLFNSTRTDNDSLYEQTMYSDFKWLTDNIKKDIEGLDTIYWGYYETFGGLDGEEPYHSNLAFHRLKVLRRVVFLGAVPHFQRIGMEHKCIAYLNLYDEVTYYDKRVREFGRQGKITVDTTRGSYGWYRHPAIYRGTYSYYDYEWDGFGKKLQEMSRVDYDSATYSLNFDYGGNLYGSIDTAKIGTVLQYVDFLRSGGTTPMERYILGNSYCDLNYFYELIGTKYMREGKYGTAISYLQRVSPSFLKTQNITEYINRKRNPFAERWITKEAERGNYVLAFDPVAEYDSLPSKMEFCRIMQRLQKNCYAAKTAEERAMSAYAYAVGLYQSAVGYAWQLTDYYRSCWNVDYYLERNTEWMSQDNNYCQKKVDYFLNLAMKYKNDDVFTMKCKILHSKYRDKMQEEHGYMTAFKQDIRETFCDLVIDYADNGGY